MNESNIGNASGISAESIFRQHPADPGISILSNNCVCQPYHLRILHKERGYFLSPRREWQWLYGRPSHKINIGTTAGERPGVGGNEKRFRSAAGKGRWFPLIPLRILARLFERKPVRQAKLVSHCAELLLNHRVNGHTFLNSLLPGKMLLLTACVDPVSSRNSFGCA